MEVRKHLRACCRTNRLTVVIILVVAVGAALYARQPSAARRALPKSAEEVQEFYQRAGLGDYVRCIKAKLPESDFPVYARNLGLKGHFDPSAHPGMGRRPAKNIEVPGAPSWWNPPGDKPGVAWYFDQNPDVPVTYDLTWHNGYVYYLAFSW